MARDLELVRADIIIHTGDICDSGHVEGLEAGKKIFGNLKIPIYCIPGNHDKVGTADKAYERIIGPREQVVEYRGVRLILTDNASVNDKATDPMGIYTDAQVRWLEEKLAASDRPTLLAGHVPLEKTPRGWFVVKNQEKVRALAKKYRVLGFMSGHVHRLKHSALIDSLIHGVAPPVSGAYVPPLQRAKGFTIWDIMPGGQVVFHETPFYFPYDPEAALKTQHT